MQSLLSEIKLSRLCQQHILFDANIFMIGIEDRYNNHDCSFENIKQVYLIPIFESFSNILIHEMVYNELDMTTREFVDLYVGKNVTIVSEDGLYGVDPEYTTIFNNIAGHERVRYVRGNSKDRGEVYSLAYASFHNINYFSSREIMVDDIARDLPELSEIDIITFDIIAVLAYVYHNYVNKTSEYNKALKSGYKRYGEDVIRRHKLPHTLIDYIKAIQP